MVNFKGVTKYCAVLALNNFNNDFYLSDNYMQRTALNLKNLTYNASGRHTSLNKFSNDFCHDMVTVQSVHKVDKIKVNELKV